MAAAAAAAVAATAATPGTVVAVGNVPADTSGRPRIVGRSPFQPTETQTIPKQAVRGQRGVVGKHAYQNIDTDVQQTERFALVQNELAGRQHTHKQAQRTDMLLTWVCDIHIICECVHINCMLHWCSLRHNNDTLAASITHKQYADMNAACTEWELCSVV